MIRFASTLAATFAATLLLATAASVPPLLMAVIAALRRSRSHMPRSRGYWPLTMSSVRFQASR